MNFLLATIALWLLSSPPAAGQAAPPRQLMSEQAFKNVTVLKGIPVDEFMNTMGFISAATNYNCTDCHVEPKAEGAPAVCRVISTSLGSGSGGTPYCSAILGVIFGVPWRLRWHV